jgi:hypothetical protein
MTVGQTRSGSVTPSDCDAYSFTGDYGYFEVWRARVSDSRNVTITLTAPFDAVLSVYTLSIANGEVTSYAWFGGVDSTYSGVEHLQGPAEPNVDYAIVVRGYDYPEVGNYSLQIQ